MDTVSVLLIEDHEGEARLNQRMLERSHTMEFRFTSLRTLEEARKALVKPSFDVVLLDLTLPDSSGINTYDQVQDLAPSLPIVIISAVADERVAVECIRRGAQEYLVKGNITSEMMTRVVRHAMARITSPRERPPSRGGAGARLPAASFHLDADNRMHVDASNLTAIAAVDPLSTTVEMSSLFARSQLELVGSFIDGVRKHAVAATAVFELARPADEEFKCAFCVLYPGDEEDAAVLQGTLLPSHSTLAVENSLDEIAMKYHTLVEHIQDGVFIVHEGTMMYVNQALADVVGYEAGEMIGASIADFIAPEYREEVQENHRRRSQGENIHEQYEIALLHKSGERRQVLLSVGRIPHDNGFASLGTVKDVTQQHRIAYLMRIQHQLAIDLAYTGDVETVFEHIINAVLRVDSIDAAAIYTLKHEAADAELVISRGVHDTFKTLANSEAFNSDHQQVLRERTTVFFDSEDLDTLASGEQLHELGVRSMGIIPLIHKGETIAALNLLSLTYSRLDVIIRQAAEAIASYLGGVLARLNAEESLRDSEMLYRAVVEKSHDAVFIYRDDKLLFTNERTAELTGYTRNELLSLNAWSLVHPEDRARLQGLAANRNADGDAPMIYDGRILTKDGTIRTGEFASTIIRYQNEVAALISVRDVTSRKSHQEELRRSDTLLRAAGFAASCFLHTTNWEDRILDVLEQYGAAANVCRVVLMENVTDEEGVLRMKQRNVWVRQEMRDSMIERVPDGFSYTEKPYDGWAEQLSAGKTIASVIDHLTAEEQMVLARQNIRSTAIIPIFNGGAWWGYIRFDECRLRRTWLASEIDAMAVGAETLSAAINRQQVSEEIIAAKERAEQADEMKKAFIANMSHEVRTPLNIILGYLVLVTELASPDVNEEVREFFDAIDDATQRLIRTVDSIMNISRFQANDISIEPVALRLDKLVANCLERFRHSAAEKSVALNFENNIGEVEVRADQNYITESLDHLIDNAIKFTPEGTVTVRLDAVSDAGPRLSVVDTGIGISPEFLDRMYDPYLQEDIGYDRIYEGIGLGLTLVKLYVEAHGASIDVQSKKGEGSTFVVQFPG